MDDELIDDVIRIAKRCQAVTKRFEVDPAKSLLERLGTAIHGLAEAWSGSWLGYHSRVYTRGLSRKRPGEHFDAQYGNAGPYASETTGEWAEFLFVEIQNEIYRRAITSVAEVEGLSDIADEVEEVTKSCLADLLPTLDAILAMQEDPVIRQRRDELSSLQTCISAARFIESVRPTGNFISSDTIAIQQGQQSAPHLTIQAYLASVRSTAGQAEKVAEITMYIGRYLQKAMKMKGKSAAKTDGPIFIGHGHAGDWKDLKDFLHDRLHLEYEEFNRVAVAGLSTKERLLEMLNKCPFAFLVMTAEDETKDGKLQARQNVVHEAGLFQGRYGFERAIILLEEGCEGFSNFTGIGYIRFKSGQISAVTEDIRRVLEREGIL